MVEEFPVYLIHPDRELYRIHRATHGPLFFGAASRAGEGNRFDLPAASGWGTCYLATSTVGACVETFGRFRVVPMELIEARRLTVAAPVVTLRLADLTNRRVLGDFGIAGDVSAGVDYATAQLWAHRLFDGGFDGIYYAARHDPQFIERSVALFGRQGDQSGSERKRFEWDTSPIPDDAIRELTEHFGIMVAPYADLAWTTGPED